MTTSKSIPLSGSVPSPRLHRFPWAGNLDVHISSTGKGRPVFPLMTGFLGAIITLAIEVIWLPQEIKLQANNDIYPRSCKSASLWTPALSSLEIITYSLLTGNRQWSSSHNSSHPLVGNWGLPTNQTVTFILCYLHWPYRQMRRNRSEAKLFTDS